MYQSQTFSNLLFGIFITGFHLANSHDHFIWDAMFLVHYIQLQTRGVVYSFTQCVSFSFCMHISFEMSLCVVDQTGEPVLFGKWKHKVVNQVKTIEVKIKIQEIKMLRWQCISIVIINTYLHNKGKLFSILYIWKFPSSVKVRNTIAKF